MATGEGRTVLVVDDDDGMREAIESLLHAAGFTSIAYASAEAMLAGGTVAGALCVVSDLKLPAMSGLDMLSELRARGERLPAIVITAHDAPVLRMDAQRLGAADFLAKPFAGSALLAAIARIARPRDAQ